MFTDHWKLGHEGCSYDNYSTRTCSCGYSYTYRKPHTYGTKYYRTDRNIHIRTCSSCGTWGPSESCYNETGVLSCKNPGTCTKCGRTITANSHITSHGTCEVCGKQFVKMSNLSYRYASDYSTCTFTFTLTPLDSSVELTGTKNVGWSSYVNYSKIDMSYVNNADGSKTFTSVITFKSDHCSDVTNIGYGNSSSLIKVNGYPVFERGFFDVQIWKDHVAPIQNEIVQKDQSSANGWATIKELTLSGTEETSDVVRLTISDKITGEKYLTNAVVPVIDDKYSYTCTPPIEGDASGRTYVVTAADRNGNTSTKEFVVSKTDGSAPALKSGTSLSYMNWTTSKNISLSFYDFGAGGVQASLDNQTSYQALIKSGEYYVWSHKFGNQTGMTEHKLYIKDALGNATVYTLTEGNTDDTVYQITYNLNGGSTSKALKTTYTVEDSFTLPNDLTKTGYTFTGWVGSNGSTANKNVSIGVGTRGNLTYTTNWKANQYTVSYNANGGSGTMSTDTISYGSNYTAKANGFSRTGYTFIGWNEKPDGTGSSWTNWIGKPWKWTYTKNITLYAQWKAKTYTITYEPNGGVGDKYTQTATYDTYFKTTENKFTRTGYTFAGFTDLKGSVGSYARLSKKNLLNDVLKNPWNFSKVDSEYQFYNYTYKIWETYCLIYWEGPYNVSYGCSPSNFTMSAKWWANNYTVKFDYKKNIDSSYEKTIVATYDSTYGELPQPVLPGWTFKGWNTKADGTGTIVTEDTVYKIVGDSTLYAQWQYNPVSVKVPQVLTGDHTGKSQFRVKCDDLKAGNIKITVPNSFLYKQTGKADVAATITARSGNNIITPTNKVCTYDITTKNGLTAGSWNGNFNIGLTLTKE